MMPWDLYLERNHERQSCRLWSSRAWHIQINMEPVECVGMQYRQGKIQGKVLLVHRITSKILTHMRRFCYRYLINVSLRDDIKIIWIYLITFHHWILNIHLLGPFAQCLKIDVLWWFLPRSINVWTYSCWLSHILAMTWRWI